MLMDLNFSASSMALLKDTSLDYKSFLTLMDLFLMWVVNC